VIGRVAEQHRPGEAACLRVATVDRGEQLLEPVAPEAPVAEDHDDVVVPGEHPESGRSLVHGRAGAKAVIEGIGVGVELGQERIEEFLVRRHVGLPSRATLSFWRWPSTSGGGWYGL